MITYPEVADRLLRFLLQPHQGESAREIAEELNLEYDKVNDTLHELADLKSNWILTPSRTPGFEVPYVQVETDYANAINRFLSEGGFVGQHNARQQRSEQDRKMKMLEVESWQAATDLAKKSLSHADEAMELSRQNVAISNMSLDTSKEANRIAIDAKRVAKLAIFWGVIAGIVAAVATVLFTEMLNS